MYREVTMIEVREVLRLRGEGLPKKRIAAQLGLDPKTVRRYLVAAATAGVRVTATVGDEDVRQVLLALHPASGRPRGDGWSRCVEQRAAIRALARRRLAPHQDSQTARAAGRRDRVSHAPPLRRPRAAVWQNGDDDPGARRRAGSRAAARYRVGRLAHGARAHAASVSCVDLHGGPLAPPFRLSHLRGNDGARHRRL